MWGTWNMCNPYDARVRNWQGYQDVQGTGHWKRHVHQLTWHMQAVTAKPATQSSRRLFAFRQSIIIDFIVENNAELMTTVTKGLE